MERYIFPKNGRPPLNFSDKRCIIIANRSHPNIDNYVTYCKMQFLEQQWASLIVDPCPINVDNPEVYVVFCVDLNWDSKMLQLYDIFKQKQKIINICRFGEDWENDDAPINTTENSLGESLLISEFQHFILKD